MLVNDLECVCNECAKSGYCDDQRTIIGVQRIVAKLRPDNLVLALFVKFCSAYTPISALGTIAGGCKCECECDMPKPALVDLAEEGVSGL